MSESVATDDTSAVSSRTAATISPSRPIRAATRGWQVAVLLVVILLTYAWNAKQVSLLWRGRTQGDASAAALAQFGQTGLAATTHFDLSESVIPVEEIRNGGPPKDGIPALTDPTFIEGRDANYLQPADRVIGFAAVGEVRAYPLKVLNYHEIVNDSVAGQPIAVTYCPLCDSVAIFDRQTPIGVRDFGVSGLLYNSNVLMYDRSEGEESLWSQLRSQAVAGPAAKSRLRTLPVVLTTWQEWLGSHPETLVLAPDTGYLRSYDRNPYEGYFDRAGLMFPAQPSSDRLGAKERVLGVWTGQSARAYHSSAFSRDRSRIADEIDGKTIVVEHHFESDSLLVVEAPPSVEWMYSLWFAWYAMHPHTDVYEGNSP